MMEDFLFHKYEVLQEIGSGGMGTVWLAKDTHLEQLVVIKESREEFLILEKALLKELEHPGLPVIYDCFRQEERTFLVMEYIEGMSLRQYLDRHGRVSAQQAVKWAEELCGILGYLHERHPAVIYRDLKPENIMVRPSGQLKLIDFGGALHCLWGDKKEAFCIGTKGYSPPQQWQDTVGDVTWDIYGLGALLHEMLTGENPAQPVYHRCSVREYDKSLPRMMDKIIVKCTEAETAKRYQSMKELEEDLRKSMSGVMKRGWSIFRWLPVSIFGGYTIVCFVRPLLSGVPESEFPFPYFKRPLIFLSITLLLYFLLFVHKNKRNFLRRREKNIWLSEKRFSGLVSSLFLSLGGTLAATASDCVSVPAVHALEEPEQLWVEMRDGDGRKMLLKYDAVYETNDAVRFELPVRRLPKQKLTLQIVATGEDGARYCSRFFYVKGIEDISLQEGEESGIVGGEKE